MSDSWLNGRTFDDITYFRMQCDLSSGLASISHLIKLADEPPKGCDTLCMVLMSSVNDYPQQVSAEWMFLSKFIASLMLFSVAL